MHPLDCWHVLRTATLEKTWAVAQIAAGWQNTGHPFHCWRFSDAGHQNARTHIMRRSGSHTMEGRAAHAATRNHETG